MMARVGRYRSKNELRFATFAEDNSIGLSFEPEVWSVGKFGGYLPDFRVDRDPTHLLHGCRWVEIKDNAVISRVGKVVFGEPRPLSTHSMEFHRTRRYDDEYTDEEQDALRLIMKPLALSYNSGERFLITGPPSKNSAKIISPWGDGIFCFTRRWGYDGRVQDYTRAEPTGH